MFEKFDRHEEMFGSKTALDSEVWVRSTTPASVPEKSLQAIVAPLKFVPTRFCAACRFVWFSVAP